MLPPEDKLTDAGLNEVLGPDGDTIADNVRLAWNPRRLEIVIVVVALEP